jgi:hypothetical protein
METRGVDWNRPRQEKERRKKKNNNNTMAGAG